MNIKDRKERHRIRQNDRAFFIRCTSLVYMGDKEVDHDWENRAICRVVDKEEHVKLGRERGEWHSRSKRRKWKEEYLDWWDKVTFSTYILRRNANGKKKNV